MPSRVSPPPMPSVSKTIAVVNSTGRQAASVIRVASAVGFCVRAQLRSVEGLVAEELAALPNVKLIPGSTSDPRVIETLFQGAQLAFINTTFWGDEVATGKALADAAKKAGVKHYVYSSMPDHSICNPRWPSLPLWSAKFTVENYIRQIELPATFLYTGIYNNNFTSLPYPLFCMELQEDGSFTWAAPFHPDIPLPFLDAEHDMGPAVLQVLKDGPRKWAGQRIALAFEYLTPREVCKAFSRGLNRRVRYKRRPIEIKVSIPAGYREQLQGIEELFGKYNAPYFGEPDLEGQVPEKSRELWEGYRSMEEYAREVFPVEEKLNGLTWMDEDDEEEEEGDEE